MSPGFMSYFSLPIGGYIRASSCEDKGISAENGICESGKRRQSTVNEEILLGLLHVVVDHQKAHDVTKLFMLTCIGYS